jgi:hypothetical protein
MVVVVVTDTVIAVVVTDAVIAVVVVTDTVIAGVVFMNSHYWGKPLSSSCSELLKLLLYSIADRDFIEKLDLYLLKNTQSLHYRKNSFIAVYR